MRAWSNAGTWMRRTCLCMSDDLCFVTLDSRSRGAALSVSDRARRENRKTHEHVAQRNTNAWSAGAHESNTNDNGNVVIVE